MSTNTVLQLDIHPFPFELFENCYHLFRLLHEERKSKHVTILKLLHEWFPHGRNKYEEMQLCVII